MMFKIFTQRFKKNPSIIILLLLFFSFTKMAAQVPKDGDFRSATTSGLWSESSSWQTRSGSLWVAAASEPGATNNVYIQSGHTIELMAAASCDSLHTNTTGSLRLGTNKLNVNGKLRAYTGTLNTILGPDGTFYTQSSVATGHPATMIVSTSGSGALNFVGSPRPLFVSGDYGAGSQTNIDLEFSITGTGESTIATGIKARSFTFNSGNYTASNSFRPDGSTSGASTAGTGDFTIKSGAYLKFTSPTANFQRVSTAGPTAHFNSFTLENGATLEISGSTAGTVLPATTVNLNGLVIFSGSGSGTLLNRGAANTNADVIDTYNDITIQGGLKTLVANTTVNGTLSMRTTSTLAPTLALGGFTLTYGSDATLQYRGIGTTAQTTTSIEWPTGGIPKNIDIFNGNGVTLHESRSAENIKFSGMTTPKLILGANNLSNVLTFTFGSGGGYVVAEGAGKLSQTVGSTPVLFPVGTSAAYTPATITNIGTSDVFSVNVAAGPMECSSADPSLAPPIQWNISEQLAGMSDCTLTLDYGTLPVPSAFTVGPVVVADCKPGSLVSKIGTISGTTLTASGFTSFSPFGVSSDPILLTAAGLPVKLTSFTAKQVDKAIDLNWVTASETNSDYFDVLSSPDGSHFKAIGKVKSAGNSSNDINYSFTDEYPHKGINYYRLKQVDLDGKFEFTKVITVENTTPSKTSIYPSLRRESDINYVDLTEYSGDEKISIDLYDTNGRQINQVTMKGGLVQPLDFGQLKAGLYFVKINNQLKSETLKFSVF
jgi:hypothetical protein